ncbi:hypothetical protein [Kribbella sp. NPDC049227]|uniref:hypothetical protein n=1 Tax=Kribbella sp. NPDC049227 TaxID=3364113 RepID=UPI00371FBD41
MNDDTCSHGDEPLYYHCCAGIGTEPAGVHALVIGVSRYERHPDSDRCWEELMGAAAGAANFARFLVTNFRDPDQARLRTVRVLLAPAEGEEKHIQVSGPWQPADYDSVGDAIDAWVKDADSHYGNLAVMYVSGHGVITKTGAQWAFLGEAGRVDSRYRYAINLYGIRERMRMVKARANLYVFDCCARVDDQVPEWHGEQGVGWADRSPGDKAIREKEVVISARNGTQNYMINAVDATLMSWALVGRAEDDASRYLLCTAGEFVDRGQPEVPGRDPEERVYAVTTSRLRSKLLPLMRDLKPGAQLGGEEPTIHPLVEKAVLTCPYPLPKFRIEIVASQSELYGILAVQLLTKEGHDTGLGGQIGKSIELTIYAGLYDLEVTPSASSSILGRTFDLDVDRDKVVGLRLAANGQLRIVRGASSI